MTVLFDTSVWIEHLRRGALTPLFPKLRSRFTLSLDAVVAAELSAGCRSKIERRVVDRLVAPFDKAGRLIVPDRGDYARAAAALSRLREEGTSLKSPGGALLDGLIAAMASRTGALLVTLNLSDFALLGRHLPLRAETLTEFAAHA